MTVVVLPFFFHTRWGTIFIPSWLSFHCSDFPGKPDRLKTGHEQIRRSRHLRADSLMC